MTKYEMSGSSACLATTSAAVYEYYPNGVQALIEEGQDVLRYWPSYAQDGRLVRAMAEAVGLEFHRIAVARQSVMDQLHVQTATWGLKYWEVYLGIPVRTGDTNWASRREGIMRVLSSRKLESEYYFKHGLDQLIGRSSVITLLDPVTNPYEINIEVGVQYYEDAPATAPVPTSDAASRVLALRPDSFWRFNDLANPPTTNSYDAAVLARTDTVALWGLGEESGTTAADSDTGAHPGTYINSPTLGVAGMLIGTSDTAASFDGVNDRVDISDHTNLRPTSFTFGGWFWFDDLANDSGTIASKLNGTNNAWGVWVGSTGSVAFGTRHGGTVTTLATAADVVASGRACYIEVTYDGTTKHIYVDGVLVASAATTFDNSTNDGPIMIGGQHFTGAHCRFRAQKIALHNSALTAAEIGDLFVRGRPVSDTQGNHAGGMIGAPTSATGAIAGDTDAAFDFDGVDDAVVVPYSAALNAATFSISGWIYRDVDTGGAEVIATTLDSAAAAGWDLRIDGSTDKVLFGMSSGGFSSLPSNDTVPVGAWTHVGATFDGTNARIYIGGVASGSGTDAMTANTTAPLRIAQGYAGTQRFNGRIDELAYYGDKVLTGAEMADLASTEPSVAPGSVPADTYTYKAVFEYGSGTTIGSGPSTSVTRSTTGAIPLSAIPSGGPGCTARLLYRKGSAGTYKLIGRINNNSDTLFIDTEASGTTDEPSTSTAITPIGRMVNDYIARTKPAHISVNVTASSFRAGINAAGNDAV